MANPAELIQQIIKRSLEREEFYSRLCLVTAINVTERTCTCAPIDDPDSEIFIVKFQTVINSKLGLFIKPKLNTHVMVTFINQNAGFISLVSEIDEILINCDSVKFNDGKNGGLININKLITQIDKNTELLKQIQTAFQNWIVAPSDGGAALKTLSSSFTSLSDIEDTKVQH